MNPRILHFAVAVSDDDPTTPNKLAPEIGQSFDVCPEVMGEGTEFVAETRYVGATAYPKRYDTDPGGIWYDHHAETLANFTTPRVTDENEDGTPAYTWTPWTDGHAVGFQITRHSDDAVTYIYLNPSQETHGQDEGDGFSPDAFLYSGTTGHPGSDSAHHYYTPVFEPTVEIRYVGCAHGWVGESDCPRCEGS